MSHSVRTTERNALERLQREWAELMDAGLPDTLTRLEVNLEDHPLTRSPQERPVLVWVRYGGRPVRVKGFTSMWTDQAVKAWWITPKLARHSAWVWSDAVQSRQLEQGESQIGRVGLSVNAAPTLPRS